MSTTFMNVPKQLTFVLVLTILFFTQKLRAQDTETLLNHLETTAVAEESPTKVGFLDKTAIGFNFGTKSLIGLEFATSLSSNWWLRAGFNHMDFFVAGYETNLNRFEQYAVIDLDAKHSNIDFLIDWQPWKANIRFVGGFGAFFDNYFFAKFQLRDNIPFNDIELTPEEIGYLTAEIDYKSIINPYLGVSFGKIVPSKRVGFSLDLGTYYKGKPNILLDGTNIVRHNSLNSEALEDNLSTYRWWPVASLRLGFNLNKSH
ncbi:MAG TPA: hypothetical protein PKA00_17445 [Saprospiraceae bacterium]|nr:hypothetical protein [Saprospiraceae bacterium]HMQ84706.1 hypothetical protein [Saprospiraceae bacterium]